MSERIHRVPQHAVGRSEVYKKYAAQYDVLCRRQDREGAIKRELARIGALRQGMLVADVGAGTGKLSRLFSDVAAVVIGVDRAPSMVEFAARDGAGFGVLLAELGSVPLRDSAFDVCIAGWSLSEIKSAHFDGEWRVHIGKALGDMERVVRSSGHVVILETLGCGCESPERDGSHFYRFLEESGFSRTWLRTDYEFESEAEAMDLTRFFFGNRRAGSVQITRKPSLRKTPPRDAWVLAECTGMFWKTKA